MQLFFYSYVDDWTFAIACWNEEYGWAPSISKGCCCDLPVDNRIKLGVACTPILFARLSFCSTIFEWFWESKHSENFLIFEMFTSMANCLRTSLVTQATYSPFEFLYISSWYGQYFPWSAAQYDASAANVDALSPGLSLIVLIGH